MTEEIDLKSPLSLRNSLRYPVQSEAARREVLIGGLLLLIPVFGWILNMGHRIRMTHRMQHGQSAWPSWENPGDLFKHGLLTFLGMVEYHSPAMLFFVLAHWTSQSWLYIPGVASWILATLAVPGYMTHYCYGLDPREIFNPFLALRRVFEGGKPYWKAWLIVVTCLLLSFTGLLVFGIGFFFTSVWFWQSAGFSFATVFTEAFGLNDSEAY